MEAILIQSLITIGSIAVAYLTLNSKVSAQNVRIQLLEDENKDLRQENKGLQLRVADLEKQNNDLYERLVKATKRSGDVF